MNGRYGAIKFEKSSHSNATSIDTHAADGIVAFEGLTYRRSPSSSSARAGRRRGPGPCMLSPVAWRRRRARERLGKARAELRLEPERDCEVPGGGGAVAARLESAAGGAGEYCCVLPPSDHASAGTAGLLLDVKG